MYVHDICTDTYIRLPIIQNEITFLIVDHTTYFPGKRLSVAKNFPIRMCEKFTNLVKIRDPNKEVTNPVLYFLFEISTNSNSLQFVVTCYVAN